MGGSTDFTPAESKKALVRGSRPGVVNVLLDNGNTDTFGVRMFVRIIGFADVDRLAYRWTARLSRLRLTSLRFLNVRRLIRYP